MVCSAGEHRYSVGVRWRGRECLSRYFGFVFQDFVERGGEEPWWGEDVGSTLALEEKGQPQW